MKITDRTLNMKKLLYPALLSLSWISLSTSANSKANVMTNDAIGTQPSHAYPADPAHYLAKRESAIVHFQLQEWQSAIKLLVPLTQLFQDDGNTWALLGHAYLYNKQYQAAVEPLKNALKLGVRLNNIKGLSSPSNDIMVKLAECYSQIGNSKQAYFWLQKALEHRWDERKSLIGNDKFSAINDQVAYKKLSGEFVQENLTRTQAWHTDLTFLVEEIKRLHVDKHHSLSKSDFDNKVAKISQLIAHASDQEIVFAMMELVASLGNGHNFIVPTYSKLGAFSQLPVEFYWFADGIFVVNANTEYQHLIGQQLTAVEGVPIESVMQQLNKVNGRDNEMQSYWLGPFYLTMPEVLVGLKIASSSDKVTMTFNQKKQPSTDVSLTAGKLNFVGFPKLAKLKKHNPNYLQNSQENYWYQHDTKEDLLYVQFNAVAHKPKQSLAEFSKELQQVYRQHNTSNMVLDLRHNSGGNGSILAPLVRSLIAFTEHNEDNQLFIIVGRNTFSAAHLLLADLERLTDAVIVGEPSGSRVNHMGEAGWFKLPHSGVWGIISSQYHQAGAAEDHRIWIAPDLPVSLDSQNYFSGKDPVMAAISNVVKSAN